MSFMTTEPTEMTEEANRKVFFSEIPVCSVAK